MFSIQSRYLNNWEVCEWYPLVPFRTSHYMQVHSFGPSCFLMQETDLITIISAILSMASITINPATHLLYILASYTHKTAQAQLRYADGYPNPFPF